MATKFGRIQISSRFGLSWKLSFRKPSSIKRKHISESHTIVQKCNEYSREKGKSCFKIHVWIENIKKKFNIQLKSVSQCEKPVILQYNTIKYKKNKKGYTDTTHDHRSATGRRRRRGRTSGKLYIKYKSPYDCKSFYDRSVCPAFHRLLFDSPLSLQLCE